MQSYDEYCDKYSFQVSIDENYEKAKQFLNGSKLYGFNIDIENPKEIIAALFIAYNHKEHMFNTHMERIING